MKIAINKKEGQELTIAEVILIVSTMIATYSFLGWILWILLIEIWK